MKKFLVTLCLGVLIQAASTASVHAQGRIAVIDLRHVFTEYHATKRANTNFQNEVSEKETQRKEWVAMFEKGETEYKGLLEKANDQAVSSQERERNKEAAEKKLLELRALEQNITEFQRSATASLQESERRIKDRLVGQIREEISRHARRQGVTLVLDKAAEIPTSGTPVVLFSAPELDLTDAVLKALNADAPPAAQR